MRREVQKPSSRQMVVKFSGRWRPRRSMRVMMSSSGSSPGGLRGRAALLSMAMGGGGLEGGRLRGVVLRARQ